MCCTYKACYIVVITFQTQRWGKHHSLHLNVQFKQKLNDK